MNRQAAMMLGMICGCCASAVACRTARPVDGQISAPTNPAPSVEHFDSGVTRDGDPGATTQFADAAEDNGCGPASNWWFNNGVLHPRRLMTGASAEAQEIDRCLSLTRPR